MHVSNLYLLVERHCLKHRHTDISNSLVVGPSNLLVVRSFTLVDPLGLGVDVILLAFKLYNREIGFYLAV